MFTDEGIFIFSNALHPRNAQFPITDNKVGDSNDTVFRDVHPLKA